jgi:hypothetical protein
MTRSLFLFIFVLFLKRTDAFFPLSVSLLHAASCRFKLKHTYSKSYVYFCVSPRATQNIGASGGECVHVQGV